MVPEAGIAPATSAWKAVMYLSTPLGLEPGPLAQNRGKIGGDRGSRTLMVRLQGGCLSNSAISPNKNGARPRCRTVLNTALQAAGFAGSLDVRYYT